MTWMLVIVNVLYVVIWSHHHSHANSEELVKDCMAATAVLQDSCCCRMSCAWCQPCTTHAATGKLQGTTMMSRDYLNMILVTIDHKLT